MKIEWADECWECGKWYTNCRSYHCGIDNISPVHRLFCLMLDKLTWILVLPTFCLTTNKLLLFWVSVFCLWNEGIMPDNFCDPSVARLSNSVFSYTGVSKERKDFLCNLGKFYRTYHVKSYRQEHFIGRWDTCVRLVCKGRRLIFFEYLLYVLRSPHMSYHYIQLFLWTFLFSLLLISAHPLSKIPTKNEGPRSHG